MCLYLKTLIVIEDIPGRTLGEARKFGDVERAKIDRSTIQQHPNGGKLSGLEVPEFSDGHSPGNYISHESLVHSFQGPRPAFFAAILRLFGLFMTVGQFASLLSIFLSIFS